MKRDIKTLVRSYVTCQKAKFFAVIEHRFNNSPYHPNNFMFTQTSLALYHPLADFFFFLLTIMDRFSWWCTATPMKEVSAATTADALMQGWIQYYGVPNTITTDRGPQFTSQIWKDLTVSFGIKHITTTSFHPQSNGILEIIHRRFKDTLRMQSNPINWYNNLPLVLLSIQSAIKEELNCSSSKLVHGQTLRLSQDPIISPTISTETNQFVFSLKERFRKLQSTPTRMHFNKSYVDLHLKS